MKLSLWVAMLLSLACTSFAAEKAVKPSLQPANLEALQAKVYCNADFSYFEAVEGGYRQMGAKGGHEGKAGNNSEPFILTRKDTSDYGWQRAANFTGEVELGIKGLWDGENPDAKARGETTSFDKRYVVRLELDAEYAEHAEYVSQQENKIYPPNQTRSMDAVALLYREDAPGKRTLIARVRDFSNQRSIVQADSVLAYDWLKTALPLMRIELSNPDFLAAIQGVGAADSEAFTYNPKRETMAALKAKGKLYKGQTILHNLIIQCSGSIQ